MARRSKPEAPQVTIVNVGYRSTNYWVISAGRSRLLLDIGWPGTMGMMCANLKRMDIPLSEIRYALATHYHIDHAGLGQEFKNAGVPLLVIDTQVAAIPLMKQWMKPQDHYVDICPDSNVVISCEASRSLLNEIGIPGQIVSTPGHSDDSVSLLLDDGSVFTGDLTTHDRIALEDPVKVTSSWQKLKTLGATRIYPGHGPARAMDQ